ncbi:MAG: AlpA family phage regulatory protein [Pseudomonadota bacterium]
MDAINPQQKTVAAQLDAARLLRMSEVEHFIGLSRTRIYVRIRAGLFPAPYLLSGRCSRWRADEVAAWVNSRTQKQVGAA